MNCRMQNSYQQLIEYKMRKTSILKLEKHDEKQEMEFELEFLKSLTIQERFKMFEERNLFLKSLLYKNDDRETTIIIK